MKTFTLFELNSLVKDALADSFPERCWIKAELSEVRTVSSGHCYIEFVERDKSGNTIVAKARGIIWSTVFSLISPYFEEITGQRFRAGMTILAEVSVTFHELYGFSLTVTDVDPSYTLGETERRRREIISMLEKEGVFTLNKELSLPRLLQRVAVVSSDTAAGYGDFCNQIENNPYGFAFTLKLFPAVMQGSAVETSVISALDDIADEAEEWDAVVLIRGGGAVSDLDGFDTYLLAANCAQFPLPIITGIGHERDTTVLDLVANTRCKTPTAVAAFIIEHMLSLASDISSYSSRLVLSTDDCLKRNKDRIDGCANRLNVACDRFFRSEEMRLMMLSEKMKAGAKSKLREEENKINLAERSVRAANPINILKQGYSMTLKDGKVVRGADELASGDELVTRFANGTVTSVIK